MPLATWFDQVACQLKPDRFDADVIIEVPQKPVRLMRLSYSSKEISKSQNISFIFIIKHHNYICRF